MVSLGVQHPNQVASIRIEMTLQNSILSDLVTRLSQRRRQLKMSYRALARRSGVSEPTAKRVLSGHCTNLEYATLAALAQGLGAELRHTLECEHPEAFKLREAEKVARRIVSAVQGSAGLEAQALSERDLKNMFRQTVHELMAASPTRIWSAV